MSAPPPNLEIRIRLKHGRHVVMGPGKAQLLEGIAKTGSIAAAGRGMEMSYKRAWMMIEAMNAAYGAPLVETNRGGAAGGGAVLTPYGATILALYRDLLDAASRATVKQRNALEALLAVKSDQ
jgi:molybdate transport system regulatory protein